MYKWRATPAASWQEVLDHYREIKCVVKTLEKVCELNHYSYSKMMGKAFKKIKCSYCSYEAKTETEWQADIDAHHDLDTKPRKEADCGHGRGHKRHRPFMAPMLKKTPPLRMSVDTLHILFINTFVTYLEATVLCYVVEFNELGRAPIEAYLASKQVPMKIVKAQDIGEMKDSLTGRDAKVFMESAEEIIPELLCFVHTPCDLT